MEFLRKWNEPSFSYLLYFFQRSNRHYYEGYWLDYHYFILDLSYYKLLITNSLNFAFRMLRISFCVSLVILALLPNLLAIMDDDHYVYVDDDVSLFQLWWEILTGYFRMRYQRQLKLLPTWHPLLQPPPRMQIATAVSTKFESIFKEGQSREGVKLERE